MSKWPKKLPKLTKDQQRIKDDFMQHWLEIIPSRFKIIENFSHQFPVKYCKPGGNVLELGAGLGDQIPYENMKITKYYALELRPNIASILKRKYPKVNIKVGDCQKKLPYRDNFFERVQAIHVLEHLPNLPFTLKEVKRVLKPDGQFCVVIPCEGGLLHAIGRYFSGKRVFEKRYGVPYDWCIRSEHINMADEIIEELKKEFKLSKSQYYPLLVPSFNLNLFAGFVLIAK